MEFLKISELNTNFTIKHALSDKWKVVNGI